MAQYPPLMDLKPDEIEHARSILLSGGALLVYTMPGDPLLEEPDADVVSIGLALRQAVGFAIDVTPDGERRFLVRATREACKATREERLTR